MMQKSVTCIRPLHYITPFLILTPPFFPFLCYPYPIQAQPIITMDSPPSKSRVCFIDSSFSHSLKFRGNKKTSRLRISLISSYDFVCKNRPLAPSQAQLTPRPHHTRLIPNNLLGELSQPQLASARELAHGDSAPSCFTQITQLLMRRRRTVGNNLS